MQKTVLAVALAMTFAAGSAQADVFRFADGNKLVLDETFDSSTISTSDDVNILGGQYYLSGGNPDFNPQDSFCFQDKLDTLKKEPDATINTNLTFKGKVSGDLVGGAVIQGMEDLAIDRTGITAVNMNSTTLVLDGGTVGKNVIGGSKITSYATEHTVTSNVGTVNLTITNGAKVNRSVVAGSLLKDKGSANSHIDTINVVVDGGSTLNGLILGSAVTQLDNNPQANEATVGSVNAKITQATINKPTSGISGVTWPSDAAIIMGGVSQANADTAVSSSVESSSLTLEATTVNGNVYMGGASTGANSTIKSGSATIVLNKGTTIKGELNTGNVVASGSRAEATLATGAQVTINSTDVTIANGIKLNGEKDKVGATSAFNNENSNEREALAKLQEITKLENGLSIDEGDYNNAISIDKDGKVTITTNSLMEDTLTLGGSSLLSLNRILMNDVRKRMGDVRAMEGTTGAWARYDGGRLSATGLENDFNTIQVGADTLVPNTNWRVGLAASYTKGDNDFRRGSADLDAYMLTGYGLWMADNGMFADVVARLAKAENDMTVDGGAKAGKLDNRAYSLSGEFGWRFDLSNQYYVEPQAELTYTYVDSEDLDLGSAQYKFDTMTSLLGRVGVATGIKCPNNKGDLYFRVSAVHEFDGDAKITGANGTSLTQDGKDTWVEYGIGGNFNLTPTTYFWADLERTAGATLETDWRATFGVRHAF